MKKLIASILSAAILASSVSALAKPLVHVSSWAYNDVSVFEQEQLMTSAFDDVTDYRVNITRGQFAELVINVLVKTGEAALYDSRARLLDAYDDIGDNQYYKTAIIYDVITGEIEKTETETDEFDPEYTFERPVLAHFYPDRELTRQEAAAITYRAASQALNNFAESGKDLTYSDSARIADWAKDPIAVLTDTGLMKGVEGSRFDPTGNITIEQAITMLYRLFRMIPTVPKPDGDGVDAKTETTIQEYDNGYVETKLNDKLYVKKGDLSIPFDADIYSNIFCVTSGDGKSYCVARTFDDSTDLFSADNGEYIKSMRVVAQEADSDYIITRSTKKGQCAFGLYDYAGNEVVPAKYSLSELDSFRETGSFPSDSYQAPDGWIYYADWEDGGHMYKVDSNGENKQKISDEDCYNISYYDGWLYYHIRGEHEDDLFCMKTDGTGVTKLSEGYCRDIETDLMYYADGTRVSEDDEQNHPYILFIDDTNNNAKTDYTDPNRVPERVLYRLTHENGGTQKEKVTDISVAALYVLPAKQGGKNWMYFLDAKRTWNAGGWREADWGSSPLYRTDGEIVECVNEDVPVENFNFVLTPEGEALIEVENGGKNVYNSNGGVASRVYSEHYIADLNLNKIEDYDEDKQIYIGDYTNDTLVSSEISEDGKALETVRKVPKLSDDKYTVYSHTKEVWIKSYGDGAYRADYDTSYYYTDASGSRRELADLDSAYSNVCRYGDTLYYISGGVLYSYDMNAGMSTAVADDVTTANARLIVSAYAARGSGLCSFPLSYATNMPYGTYSDRDGNVWKCNLADGTVSEIYPDGGTRRYGTPLYLVENNDAKTLMKVDTEGNYSTIMTGVHVKYAIYVPENGEDKVYRYQKQYQGIGMYNDMTLYNVYADYYPYNAIYDVNGSYHTAVYDKSDEFYKLNADRDAAANQ